MSNLVDTRQYCRDIGMIMAPPTFSSIKDIYWNKNMIWSLNFRHGVGTIKTQYHQSLPPTCLRELYEILRVGRLFWNLMINVVLPRKCAYWGKKITNRFYPGSWLIDMGSHRPGTIGNLNNSIISERQSWCGDPVPQRCLTAISQSLEFT